jgi:hypothetical protein
LPSYIPYAYTSYVQRKRKNKNSAIAQQEPKPKKPRKTLPSKVAKRNLAKSQHTLLSLLEAYSPETEYGSSIRAMNDEDQVAEVTRFNKGVDKGTNIAIKSKVITAKYQVFGGRKNETVPY